MSISTIAPVVSTPNLRDTRGDDPVATQASWRSADKAERAGSPRHQLVQAIEQALGDDQVQSKAVSPALLHFAHALMRDLRTMTGDASSPADGTARRDWNDLPQRLQALATAVGAPAAADIPAEPNPVTTTTAAVHLQLVPSSHLIEAFVALQRALGDQEREAARLNSADNKVPTTADLRAGLAGLIGKIAAGLAPDSRATLPSGSVVNLTA
jgi:hypothetical protein